MTQELKVYKIMGIEFDSQFYHKSEADKVIAEKDAEIRRLQRALYKACANWAICKACILEYFCIKINAKKWEIMHHKCRAKAEEYK